MTAELWYRLGVRGAGRRLAVTFGLVASLGLPMRGRAAPPPSPTAEATGEAPVPVSPSDGSSVWGRPRIRIDAAGPLASRIELRRIEPEPEARIVRSPTWTTVCTTPCDRQIDGSQGERFVIGGRGISASTWFTLLDRRGPTTLTVRPGRRAVAALGWLAGGLGIAGVVGGAVTMSFADDDRQRLEAGAIALGAGIVAAIVGGILIWRGRTSVRIGPPR